MGVQRILLDGQRTWTVTGDDHLPAGPVEEYLEFLRVAQQASPNTVRSYATSLARWWEYLATAGTAWDEVGLPFFVSFVSWLRTGLPGRGGPAPGRCRLCGPVGVDGRCPGHRRAVVLPLPRRRSPGPGR